MGPLRRHWRRLTVATLTAATLMTSAGATLDTVSGLFQAGDYEGARQALQVGSEGTRPGEEVLWRARLATRPVDAVDLLQGGLENRRLPDDIRLRMALEIADIEYGREGYGNLLDVLGPFLTRDGIDVPGEAFLKAGLALRALGRRQQAREMLASVHPGDPAFGLARITLGDIGLDQNDPGLAHRYYDSAASEAPLLRSRLAAGRWRALRNEGRNAEAEDLLNELADDDAGSLALLEIRRRRRLEEEELSARLAETAEDSPPSTPTAPTGRYALQLGAFSDRSLALEFQRKYRAHVSDLRIDEVRDARGQFLYKIRTGSYVNPALARTAASELAHRLELDVIVADLTLTPADSD